MIYCEAKNLFIMEVSTASEKKSEEWQFSALLKQKGSHGVRNQYFRKALYIPVT